MSVPSSSSTSSMSSPSRDLSHLRKEMKELRSLMKNFKLDKMEKYLGKSLNDAPKLHKIDEDAHNKTGCEDECSHMDKPSQMPEIMDHNTATIEIMSSPSISSSSISDSASHSTDLTESSLAVSIPAAIHSIESKPALTLSQLITFVETELHGARDLHRLAWAFANYDYKLGEWCRYEYCSPLKRYTRNLISTDHRTYTLMLLCWNPHQESPIHDHAGSECFMLNVRGTITETQYEWPEGYDRFKDMDEEPQPRTCASASSSPMILSQNAVDAPNSARKARETQQDKEKEIPRVGSPLTLPSSALSGNDANVFSGIPSPASCCSSSSFSTASSACSSSSTSPTVTLSTLIPHMKKKLVTHIPPGTLGFINDSIGLHKVGNETDEIACSLHCYIPPYQSCRLFAEDCSVSRSCIVSFDTEGGARITCDDSGRITETRQ